MSLDNVLKHAGVFVLLVAVVAGGAAVAGSLQSPEATNMSQTAPDQFQPANAVATVPEEAGSIQVDADTEDRVVLVDRSHGNSISSSQLNTLTSTLIENGYEVRFYGSQSQPGRNLNASLRDADAFVVANPTTAYTGSEVDGVEAYADGGGRVLVLGDPASLASTGLLGGVRQVDNEPTEMSSRFGVSFGSGYLYNMDDNANNFKNVYATPTGDSSLTDGVDRLVLQNAAPVSTAEGTVVASATSGTHLSTTRANGSYGVVVRSGNVTAIGDTSFLEPHATYDADNEVLVGNVVDFLVTGEKGDCVLPEAGTESQFGPARPDSGGTGGATQPTPPAPNGTSGGTSAGPAGPSQPSQTGC